MKTHLSKTTLIIVLLLSNVASGAYIVSIWKIKPEAAAATAQAIKKTPASINKGKAMAAAPGLRGSIGDIVSTRNSEIEVCYDHYLKVDPVKAQGQITVQWKLDEQKRPLNPSVVSSDFYNDELVHCIFDQVKTLEFSEVDSNILVSHKFMFRVKAPTQINFEN